MDKIDFQFLRAMLCGEYIYIGGILFGRSQLTHGYIKCLMGLKILNMKSKE